MRRRVLTVLLCTLLTGLPAAPVRAAAPPPGAVAPTGDYGWPVPGWPRVARPFDPPESTYGAGHRGVDLVAAPGTAVLAAGSGTVAFAGPLAGRGVVSVLHADGLRTTYEPVTAAVAVGAHVQRGDVLGVLEPGHPGCPAPSCLHWGVRRGAENYLDPLRLLGRWEVRLLPWRG
ncbi:M23 family metallopeptidase [Rhodococcus antarcticus]|uniref:M23 family metallopeptidase n=1 Tax=Rhodococcus antarcticus TaxID=2987751 RepID=UPI003F494FC7